MDNKWKVVKTVRILLGLTEETRKCDICSDYFHNRGNAMNHVEAKHSTVACSCEECGKGFSLRNTWQQHKSVHPAKKTLGLRRKKSVAFNYEVLGHS